MRTRICIVLCLAIVLLLGALALSGGNEAYSSRRNEAYGVTPELVVVAEDTYHVVETVVKTMDVDDDQTTDDFPFDDDVANNTAQSLLVCTIPAYGELLSVQVRCLEGIGAALFQIDVGTSSGATDIINNSQTDDLDEFVVAPAAGGLSAIVGSSSAIEIWFTGHTGNNWNNNFGLGRWSIAISYIDYGAAYTEKGI